MRGNDADFLAHANRLAARGLGRTWPNPTVGCIIVKDNRILGAARTADGGRPHAESQALAQAGDAARGATAYVTLEPCAHHGQTPPCAEALIRAGIARVVIGCTDPDPRVSGRGIAMLQAAGVDVTSPSRGEVGASSAPGGGHLPRHEATPTRPASDLLPQGGGMLPHDTNRGFFRRIGHGLPHVGMKLATSTDYFMARSDGGGQWLTGEFARQHGHRIRGMYDAILTGIGTVLADDPLLTIRPPNAPHPNLVRIVADRQLRLPLTSKLVKTARQFPLWVITTPEGVEQHASHATDLRECGVKLLALAGTPQHKAHTRGLAEPSPSLGRGLGEGMRHKRHRADNVENPHPPASGPLLLPKEGEGFPSDTTTISFSVEEMLRALAAEGLTRVLIEAGPQLSSVFLASGLVETLYWYRAPIALGNAGAAPMNALEGQLAHATRSDARMLGEDTYEAYEL